MTDSTWSDPRALLFDLGNVVIEVDFERVLRRWASHAGVEPEQLRDRFGPDVHYECHERGELNADAYFDTLRTSLGIDIEYDHFLGGWNEVFVDEIDGIAPLLEHAGRHLPLYAFSNTNDVHYREIKRRFAPLMEPFEIVFVSCDLGQRKPEVEAYRAVAETMGMAPADVLFFDDSADNIKGAHSAGMPAVHVRSIDDVRRALAPLLGPSARP